MFTPPGSCAFLFVSHVSGWCCTFLYVSHFMFMREPYVLCLCWRASLWVCFTFMFTHTLCLFMVLVIRRSSVCFTLRDHVLCSIFIGRVDASLCMFMFYTYCFLLMLYVIFLVWCLTLFDSRLREVHSVLRQSIFNNSLCFVLNGGKGGLIANFASQAIRW